jgi:hypothetical protein
MAGGGNEGLAEHGLAVAGLRPERLSDGFRIADTFTDSLARLSGENQKAAKLTAIDLQLNPGGTGQSFHWLDRARDKNFWSVRAGSDIRLIVHREGDGLMLCYLDQRDSL